MQSTLLLLFSLCALPIATAFLPSPAPAFLSRSPSLSSLSSLSSTPPPAAEEEGGLDLDLGEMFDLFDAADKEEDFDKALSDVKKDKP